MISNRCARKSLVTNCNSIISKNYLRFLVDSNVFYYKKNELTTLSHDTLNIVPEKADYYVIYADTCTISREQLAKMNISFKKIPRDINRF